MKRIHVTLIAAVLLIANCRAADDQASQILAASGVKGGLIVHVGCGDGKLTAALRLADNYVVQGLDASEKNIEVARATIRSLGLYGPVSVMHWDGKKLPYVDNLVTLVVCEDSNVVSKDEIMRVLRPQGAAAIKQAGQWKVTIKHDQKTLTNGNSTITAPTTTLSPKTRSLVHRGGISGSASRSGSALT